MNYIRSNSIYDDVSFKNAIVEHYLKYACDCLSPSGMGMKQTCLYCGQTFRCNKYFWDHRKHCNEHTPETHTYKKGLRQLKKLKLSQIKNTSGDGI